MQCGLIKLEKGDENMNIITGSRAFFILIYLINCGQSSYKQLRLLFGEKTYECTKDSMQKLVRAKYVESFGTKSSKTFFITKLGYNTFFNRYNEDYFDQYNFRYKPALKVPVLDTKTADRVNRQNYEFFISKQIAHEVSIKAISENICGYIPIPEFKNRLKRKCLLSTQQIQGSFCSLAFYIFSNSNSNRTASIFFVYHMYDRNFTINDTTECNLFQLIKEQVIIELNKKGAFAEKYEYKAVFIYSNYDLVYQTLKYSQISASKREYAKKNNPNYFHCRGRLIDESMELGESNIFLLVNDSDFSILTEKICSVLLGEFSNKVLKDNYNLSNFRCWLPVCDNSFGSLTRSLEIITGKDKRGLSCSDMPFFITKNQIPFLRIVLRENYRIISYEKLKDNVIYVYEAKSHGFKCERIGEIL